MIQAASDGVSVIASTRDISSDTVIVIARARKKTPGTPSKNASGMKTTTGVRVDPVSGRKISPTAVWTALRRSMPVAIFVWIASTTTIASSMTRPMALAMPPRVIRLKVMLSMRIASSVTRTVTGMTTIATRVEPRSLRNAIEEMTTERMRPKIMASHTLLTESRTSSDWS